MIDKSNEMRYDSFNHRRMRCFMASDFDRAASDAASADRLLCRQIQTGDSEALAVLLRRYSRLVAAKASNVYCRSMEQDDLYQEGMIALIRAAVTFDAGRTTSFKTYALACVMNRFRDLIRQSGGQVQTLSIEEAPLPETESPEKQVIARDELERLRQLISRELSDKERAIILDHLAGLSYAQIAEKHGCEIKSVNNTLYRVRKKLKS